MKYLREKHFNGEYNDIIQCKNCVHGGGRVINHIYLNENFTCWIKS